MSIPTDANGSFFVDVDGKPVNVWAPESWPELDTWKALESAVG